MVTVPIYLSAMMTHSRSNDSRKSKQPRPTRGSERIRSSSVWRTSVIGALVLCFACSISSDVDRTNASAGIITLALVQPSIGELPWVEDGWSVPSGRVNVIPLVAYDQNESRWISAGWYDGTTEKTRIPNDIGSPENYWNQITRADLICVWNSDVRVSGSFVVTDDSFGPVVRRLHGTLSAPWQQECALLVGSSWNAGKTWPMPESIESSSKLPFEREILRQARSLIKSVSIEFEQQSMATRADFRSDTSQPARFLDTITFRLTLEPTESYWISLCQRISAPPKGEQTTEFVANYFAVVTLSSGSILSTLWQQCSVDSETGNIGTHFRFLGAADLDEDGIAEVALQRYMYERSVYEIYQLQGNELVRVAEAYDVGM